MQGSPPPPHRGKIAEPAITRTRPRLDRPSLDDAAAVRAAEEASQREGLLLAQLSTAHQEAEEAQRKIAESEARARELEARLRAQPTIAIAPQSVPSVAPPGEAVRFKGEFRVSDLKGWKILLVGIIAAVASLVVAVIKAVQPERAPVVIDNSATITTLQSQVNVLTTRLETLTQHARATDAYNASVFEADCIDIPRTTPRPDIKPSVLNVKRGKCPALKIDVPPPILSSP